MTYDCIYEFMYMKNMVKIPEFMCTKVPDVDADLKNSSVSFFCNFKYLVVHRTRSVKDGVFNYKLGRFGSASLSRLHHWH